ncbi:MAG: acylphosphatase [Pleurocapsa sp.]
MYTRAQAKKLGIRGYVRNLKTGDVEIVAVGEPQQIDALINAVQLGSPSAVVNNLQLEIIDNNSQEFQDFEIRR